jgi:predicted transcriptional regulator
MNHITQKQAAKLMEAADEAATKYLRDEGEFHPDHHEVAAMFLCNAAIQQYIDSIDTSQERVEKSEESVQMAEPDFCDKNCVWSDHHPDCVLFGQAAPTGERA